MFRRKLLQRIQSLENYLGLVYIPREHSLYEAHIAEESYSLMTNLKKLLQERDEEKKKGK